MKPKVNFLIEEMGDNENVPRLVQAAKDQGFAVQTCKYVPFESGTYNQFPDDACVFYFGSLGLARQLIRTKPWVPGPFCNLNNYKCSTYRSYWHKYLWNKQAIFMPYGEFKDKIDNVLAMLGYPSKEWSLFIRPDDGFKTFTGQTIDVQSKTSDLRYLDSKCKPETLICISPTRTPLVEWRVFCLGKKIIAASQYRIGGRFETTEEEGLPPEPTKYLKQVLKDVSWFPEQLYVVDIGAGVSMANNNLYDISPEYGIIELNSFSCSGMYKCDVNAIVKAAAAVAKKEYKDVNQV